MTQMLLQLCINKDVKILCLDYHLKKKNPLSKDLDQMTLRYIVCIEPFSKFLFLFFINFLLTHRFFVQHFVSKSAMIFRWNCFISFLNKRPCEQFQIRFWIFSVKFYFAIFFSLLISNDLVTNTKKLFFNFFFIKLNN